MFAVSRKSHAFSLVQRFACARHCERSEAIHGLSRRSPALTPRNDGFSLVELSIVLVILGLLTGGILTGQSLIRAAELRSVTTEFQTYQTAVQTFRDKYFALPGDMRNATDFWGAANSAGSGGECAAPGTDTGSGTQTCNGDGDGKLATSGDTTRRFERFRFWQHLANAGLVEGSYTGVQGSAGNQHSMVAENVPVSKLSNAGWTATDFDNIATDSASWFEISYGNIFFFGGGSTTNNATTVRILSAEEAWNIDSKIDDGKPGQGGMYANTNGNCADATDHTDINADYDLQESGANCALIFKGAF